MTMMMILTVLLQYVGRYEENVTPGMIASVPSQGNEQMAASILQVNDQSTGQKHPKWFYT